MACPAPPATPTLGSAPAASRANIQSIFSWWRRKRLNVEGRTMNDEQEQRSRSSFIVHRSSFRERILALYDALSAHFAHEPHWWPIISDTPQFEMLIGAVLV